MNHEIIESEPMKVLIVDDNKDNIELIYQILEDECSLETANSGNECIDKSLTYQPDLILLDVNMPEMDGYETIQILKQNDTVKSIPVIFVSAYYTQSSMIVKGLEQGAFDYLAKPVDEDILLAKVHVVKRLKMAEDIVLQQKNELLQINEKLEKADKLKSIFLASMSHELRTPLNSIIGFTGLMLMEVAGKINDTQKDQLNRVKRNANHLLELINDVLDISKIEAGMIQLEITEFNLSDLLNEISQSIDPEINTKGLKLEIILPDNPVTIISDKRRIQQIVMNLMSNALKFTENGSISCRLTEEHSEKINIDIEDTGNGICPDDMRRLFEPFQQINMDYTSNYKGTGLGLYLCKKLSNVINGNINAESQLGQGSKFSISLPVILNQSNIEE